MPVATALSLPPHLLPPFCANPPISTAGRSMTAICIDKDKTKGTAVLNHHRHQVSRIQGDKAEIPSLYSPFAPRLPSLIPTPKPALSNVKSGDCVQGPTQLRRFNGSTTPHINTPTFSAYRTLLIIVSLINAVLFCKRLCLSAQPAARATIPTPTCGSSTLHHYENAPFASCNLPQP
ncbi:hypothetical protein BJ508DRAFT_123560 [Ascobolus immersus RN42]|uniref:Uncharacterized protein n=1 Tax=Ascobolus immersus RN42 TaxID=1160509 RepID=A0A3N4I5V2_ASCIM|nr:hypothetical protein BJ508DRAFT_123560 [Ascobolus immersus RN42]